MIFASDSTSLVMLIEQVEKELRKEVYKDNDSDSSEEEDSESDSDTVNQLIDWFTGVGVSRKETVKEKQNESGLSTGVRKDQLP